MYKNKKQKQNKNTKMLKRSQSYQLPNPNYSNCSNYERIHCHNHFSAGPHLYKANNPRCISASSELNDQMRQQRYYFTKEKTSVRVYVVYSKTNDCNTNKQAQSTQRSLNRDFYKLSLPKIKQLNLKISDKFKYEALSMFYNPRTNSLSPFCH
jgi:hypothetical protein